MQYSVISTRKTCLYGSQPLSLVYACKTALFGAELHVCMGPSPYLSFCACKTAWLASEILVSSGPSPRLWFLDAKQRLFTRITSLQGYQPSPVVLWMQTSVISTWITCLYVYQLSSVFIFMRNCDFRTRLTSLHGSQTSAVFFGLCGFQPSCVVFGCKTPTFGLELLLCLQAKLPLQDQNNKSLLFPDMTCHFVHVQQRA